LLHYDLRSFFLTAGTQAYAKGVSVIEPLAKRQPFITEKLLENYGYILWHTFLVFPILNLNGIADMIVSSPWIYYFDHSIILSPLTKALAFPLN
jgi:hypothetical protein